MIFYKLNLHMHACVVHIEIDANNAEYFYNVRSVAMQQQPKLITIIKDTSRTF